jgi:hypothetical protein
MGARKGYFIRFLSCSRRAVTIHADGDKSADRGGSALPFYKVGEPAARGWRSRNSRRVVVSPTRIQKGCQDGYGAAIGASRASRTPECGTLCCRQWGMAALLHAGRSSSSAPCRWRQVGGERRVTTPPALMMMVASMLAMVARCAASSRGAIYGA